MRQPDSNGYANRIYLFIRIHDEIQKRRTHVSHTLENMLLSWSAKGHNLSYFIPHTETICTCDMAMQRHTHTNRKDFHTTGQHRIYVMEHLLSKHNRAYALQRDPILQTLECSYEQTNAFTFRSWSQWSKRPLHMYAFGYFFLCNVCILFVL